MKDIRNVKQVVIDIASNNDIVVQTPENGTILRIDQVGDVVITDHRCVSNTPTPTPTPDEE